MWHEIPTQISKSYKGWFIYIGKASKWNNKLKVNISPIIQPNTEYINTLSPDIRSKLYKQLMDLPDKYTYVFEVDNLYPMIYPWGEATNRAYKYIDETLGRFNITKAIQDIKL